MKKKVFDNFVNGMYTYNEFYRCNKLQYPLMSLICYDEFLSIADREYFEYCRKEIYSILEKKVKFHLYIFIISYKGKYSEKIFDYYKIWKNKKFDLPLSLRGEENKYVINGEELYISSASFELNNVGNILEFLFNNQKNAFILCSKDKKFNNCHELYENLCSIENKLDGRDYFGFKYLFEKMADGEIVINVSSDGEEIGVNVFEKNKVER